MEFLSMLIPIVAGIIGGNFAGSSNALKKFSLGPIGNSIVGLLGGAAGGQILGMITGNPPAEAATASSVDMGSLLTGIIGGGAGGSLLLSVVGALRNKFSKKT